MNRDEKAQAIEEIAADITAAEAIFAVDYRGISVPQAAELRGKLREADASFRIVKNRLTKIAADKAGEERLSELLQGPTALTFVRGDTAMAACLRIDAGLFVLPVAIASTPVPLSVTAGPSNPAAMP